MQRLLFLALFTNAIMYCFGDVYMHSMRGSNNRLKGQGRERENDNRLFDSQNNERGGYNAGSVYYYAGSQAFLEWTAQHSCKNGNANCEFIIQYACDDLIRDGTSETTIPRTVPDAAQCDDFNCDTDPSFGRQESWESYFKGCVLRSRNKGLYTSNQNLKGNSALFTRQNNEGTRYGYECPEERDYYPYWHPTMWRDVAILTNSPTRCPAYVAESQNVKPRWSCSVPDEIISKRVTAGTGSGFIPITRSECEKIALNSTVTNTTLYATWVQTPAFQIPAPVCRENVYSRDNHLGNVDGGFPMNFNWTIPAHIHERCVLRLRYNISTGDFPAFIQPAAINSGSVNASLSRPNANRDTQADFMPIWSNYQGMKAAENPVSTTGVPTTSGRGYNFVNDPKVDFFGQLLNKTGKLTQPFKLTLNVDTSQFGRTFQDRSHRFAIRSVPSNIPANAKIHNVQVRGKRGNIVQTYPAVEYDFVPNRLQARTGDFIHFQWTGSNNNPNNNDGQGREGSDRSNIASMRPARFKESKAQTYPITESPFGTNYPKKLVETKIFVDPSMDTTTASAVQIAAARAAKYSPDLATSTTDFNFLGWDRSSLAELATIGTVGFGGDMDELDDAGTYFDMGPKQVNLQGVFHYMCTRNNNFSNRSQKGKIVVTDSQVAFDIIGWNGGSVGTGSASLTVSQGAFLTTGQVQIEAITDVAQIGGGTGGPVASDYIRISNIPGFAQLTINYKPNALSFGTSTLSYAPTAGASFSPLSTASLSDGQATVNTNQGGIYVVSSDPNYGILAGVIVSIVVFIAGLIALYVYFKKKGETERYEYANAPGAQLATATNNA